MLFLLFNGLNASNFTAKFATKEQDKERLQFNSEIQALEATPSEVTGEWELSLENPVESLSIPEVSVTISPANKGIVYNKTAKTVGGKPTQTGVYTITIKAKNKSTTKEAKITLNVPHIESTAWTGKVLNYYGYDAVAGLLDSDLQTIINSMIADNWSVTVSGLPTGLKYSYDSKAKTASITGTATKEGDYTLYLQAKQGTTTELAATTIKVIFPELEVVAGNVTNKEVTATMGTVTGGGNYYAGKKVTLKATAAKDYAFAGWYKNAGAEIWVPLGEGEPNAEDYRKTSYNYVTADENETIMGAFVDKTKDAGDIDLILEMAEPELDIEETIYQVGTNYVINVGAESWSLPSVSVSGLPTGLKFDAKTMTITGKPTKYGELKDVVFTLKNVSNTTGKKVTMRFRVEDQRATDLEDLKYDTIPGETGGYDLIEVGTEVNEDLLGVGPEKLKNWTVSGLPAGVKFNKATGTFSGRATAVGVTYLVTLTKGQQKATVLLKTKGNPELKVEVRKVIREDFDADLCGVDPDESLFIITGTGSYATGKKVTLNVSAMPKNWVFIGWAEYQTEDNKTALVLVSPDAKYAFNMPDADANNEVKLVAVFTHVFGWDEEE